jgi:PrpF protein
VRLQGEMIRGGTSKCWIFDHHDVVATGVDVDTLLLAAFNAADPCQIDGVGGASSTTSKAAIVQASSEPGVDVEYAFAQVGVGDERVEWTSNCGNCATAVALYAIHHGLVSITSDITTVRMINLNTGARLTGTIPTPDLVPPDEGTAAVPGTSALGVPVLLGFQDPAGSTTGRALPTGRPLDTLTRPDGPIETSLIDAGAPAALFDAKAFGLDGTNSPPWSPRSPHYAVRPPSRWVWPGRTTRSATPCRRSASSAVPPRSALRAACWSASTNTTWPSAWSPCTHRTRRSASPPPSPWPPPPLPPAPSPTASPDRSPTERSVWALPRA